MAIRWLVILAICAVSAQAQRGPGGGQFRRYPFDKWAAENKKPQIKWTVRVNPARLSVHQRLLTHLQVAVDGSELAKRRANGQILLFARIEDAAGHRYQTGYQAAVPSLLQGNAFGELNFGVSAFILPGDYVISLAVCDPRTLEHSFTRQNLHVPAIAADPLPNSWKGLAPVEFLPASGDNPDAWYLPQTRSRVMLPLETKYPARVEILVNTTPSALGSLAEFRRNMEVVVPSAKVLAGIDPAGGSVGLSVIDLNRGILTYQQPNPGVVDWRRNAWAELRLAYAESGIATVDAATLAGQNRMLDYFYREAVHRLGSDAETVAHVLIVLSAPVFFTQQEKPSLPELPVDPGRRVFYIRYSPDATDAEGSLNPFTDDLERVLKPMRPHVFRVTRPEQFRRALGAILDEISRMQPSR